ncbi:MAG: iron ABC transporter substrate-binding protein [Bacteroidetes bacterium]|nr:MAG: iron ABC transporter substrate-binding protein [Bacteroidota bacterium]
MKTNIISGLLLLSLLGCKGPGKRDIDAGSKDALKPVELKYAREFRVSKNESSCMLYIHPGGAEAASDSFLLSKAPCVDQHMACIPVPCRKIVCLSSTQLSYFLALGQIDPIVAINSSRYLRHEGMRARIETGEVARIGKEGNFNLEMVAALDPDLIFVSPFKAGGFDMLRNLGIPLVPMAAYNEETPLGRAEWVKMIALFLGMEQEADSLFNAIEKRYNDLKELAAGVEDRPGVFSGKMRSGTWYVPGGNSFYAHYFRDAGADYIIKDEKQGAYPVDFETVYSKASECEYWRIIHPEKAGFDLDALAAQDPRYRDFRAFREKKVIFCNIREKPYYEQVAMKPDVILADYIHHFHPEILPDHEPCFYEKLQ